MNLAALDLNLLVALEALLVEESVGRAASRVGLSQPAMSHALNRLRALVGDPLLVRTGAGMQPTRRAQSMRSRCARRRWPACGACSSRRRSTPRPASARSAS